MTVQIVCFPLLRNCVSCRDRYDSVRTSRNSDLPRNVIIVYHRLPNDVHEYPGLLRYATSCMLTVESRLTVAKPVVVEGKVVADTGYWAIWFIFKNQWYDIGKFYDRSGNWLGYYCDIVKPVSKLLADRGRTIKLTDLYLDLWISAENKISILDENEFVEAIKKRYISKRTAEEAKNRLNLMVEMVRSRKFPPREIRRIKPLNDLEPLLGKQ